VDGADRRELGAVEVERVDESLPGREDRSWVRRVLETDRADGEGREAMNESGLVSQLRDVQRRRSGPHRGIRLRNAQPSAHILG
jgi:hypothetical protein